MNPRAAGLWWGALVVLFLGLSACASDVPPKRLADYMGPQTASGSRESTLPDRGNLRAGLVLISDQTAPAAAPGLPDQAQAQMAEQLQQQFRQFLPVWIDRIVSAEGLRPGKDVAPFVELGRQHGLDYLVVVVASATEQEYPLALPVGGTTHVVPGWRRDNWSLVEAGLFDVKRGKVLVQAEGRGWATLDWPTTPDINQWYPVIWKRPLDPNWRWWPPTYESAPHTLRVISMQEAVKRLVPNFQEAWLQKREAESLARG
jgi:hypothetical protein